MRLKISLHKKNCILPLNYQHLLQGLIYQSLPKNDEGTFYHDEGYQSGNKKYKMFVFSNLIGRNHVDINKRTITFEEDFHFFFASEDEELVQRIYRFMQNNKKIILGNEMIDIVSTDILTNPDFRGNKQYVIRTISPLVAYRTVDKRVEYYKPSSEEFEVLVRENLGHKLDSLGVKETIVFKIIEVISEKKRKVHYKNTFYEAYNAVLKIEVNSSTLSLLLNTGISAKGSAGFGMIETVYEKNLLSV